MQRRLEDHGRQMPVGWGLLGRILDGLGRPLDGKGVLQFEAYMPLFARPLNPMGREPVRHVLDVGVRAINAMLTVGRGQRLGLFAGSGVGKSVLLGMMARYTKADVVVVGLIGERGREVKDSLRTFWVPKDWRVQLWLLPRRIRQRCCACTVRPMQPVSPSISAVRAKMSC